MYDGNSIKEIKAKENKKLENKKKKKILNSFVKSKQLIAEKPYDPHAGKIVFPDMEILTKKTFEELKNLNITKIEAYVDCINTLGMTLNDGSACKAGT